MLCTAILLAIGSVTSSASGAPRHEPLDVLVYIGDDIAFEDQRSVPTPNLDRLAQAGTTFMRAYANPTCAPSRRSICFGKYWDTDSGLACSGGHPPPLATVSIADLAHSVGAQSALFGKWHLGPNPIGPWELAPIAQGFTRWIAGHPENLNTPANQLFCQSKDYFRWLRVEDGSTFTSRTYEPLVVNGAAARWWADTPSPKLAWVACSLPHEPFHAPPPSLLPPGFVVGDTPRAQYESMIMAMDKAFGAVLAHVDLTHTLVIFVGDNGTPINAAPDPTRAKTSVFERGIHVPLIVAGPGFAAGVETDRLVHIVDIYASAAIALGAHAPLGQDGIPLQDPDGHKVIVCGGPDERCSMSARLKLRRTPAGDELYDLGRDPAELHDVRSEPEYAAGAAALRKVLDDFDAR